MCFSQVGTKASASAAAAEEVRGHGRILLVEDEEGIRESLSESLREAAIKLPGPKLGQKPWRLRRLEAVISDGVFPNMSGPKIVDKKPSQTRGFCMCPGHVDDFAQRQRVPHSLHAEALQYAQFCVEAEEAVDEYGVANLALRLISKFIG